MATTFSSFDLNLMRVFDAIMEERSVLRAGQKVFLSQSAVSHSLARLRELLDDELFVRATTGMQPTARAMSMAPLVRDALRSLESAIDSRARSRSPCTMPYPTVRLAVTALWHKRHEGDASQGWLHEVVHRATENLRSGADRASARESRAARR